MIVTAFNPETDDLEKTYLAVYTPKGSASLSVKNSNRFNTNSKIMIGRMGDERTEIVSLTAVNADGITLTVGTTLYEHNGDDPVYLLRYDKVRFYRQNGEAGTPIVQLTTDIDVDNAEEVTLFDDTSSLATHFYTITYINSITSVESDPSDPVPAGGFKLNTIGKIIDIVVRRVRDPNFNVLGIEEYLDVANEVGSDLISQAQRPYTFLRRKPLIDTVAGQGWVPLPTGISKFNHAYIDTVSGNYNRFTEITPMSDEEFNNRYDNNQTSQSDNITAIAIDEINKRLLIYPTPKTSQVGMIKLDYYKIFDEITDVGDVVETPNNLIYRYKFMAEFYSAKSETDTAWARLGEKYESKYGNEIVKMQRSNRMDVGTPRSFVPPYTRRRRRFHR